MAKAKSFIFPSDYENLPETHLAILKQAESLLGNLGVTGLELKTIATRLDVSPSLINHYYKSSEELIFDTVLYSYQKIIFKIQNQNIHQKSPEFVARSWIQEMLDWETEYPGIGVILEFPRQVLRSGNKKVNDSDKMLEHFIQEMSALGVRNIAFMASAVRSLQKGTEFKILSPVKVAALIKTDSKFAAYTSLLGFSTIGGGLWMAGRRPADSKQPFWLKLGFNPAKQLQSTIDHLIEIIKKNT